MKDKEILLLTFVLRIDVPLFALIIPSTSKKRVLSCPFAPKLLYMPPATYSFTYMCTNVFLCPDKAEPLSLDAKALTSRGLKSCMNLQAASLIAGLDTS